VPQDVPFSYLYQTSLAILVVSGIYTLLTSHHTQGEEIRKTIYASLYNSSGILAGVTFASVGAGSLWILFMSAFVRPLVWGTVFAGPLACVGLFAFVVADSVLGKVNDPPYLDVQYNT
jgi:hypothetical protein